MSAQERMSFKPSSRVARSDAIVFTEFEDATVMMDAEVGSYYELNAVGARVWALAEFRPRVAEVCAALAAEYGVAPGTCADEVRAFLDELLRLEVIRMPSGDDVMESGNRETRSRPATPRASGKGGTRAREHERVPDAKLAWSTPTIRAMDVARTAEGSTPGDTEIDGIMDPYYPES